MKWRQAKALASEANAVVTFMVNARKVTTIKAIALRTGHQLSSKQNKQRINQHKI